MHEELKERLVRRLRFLEGELRDYNDFRGLTWETYNTDRKSRRDAERWIENILNSTIDIARLALRGEGDSGNLSRDGIALGAGTGVQAGAVG